MYNIDMRYIAIEILYRVTMDTKIPIILPSGRRRAFVGVKPMRYTFLKARLGVIRHPDFHRINPLLQPELLRKRQSPTDGSQVSFRFSVQCMSTRSVHRGLLSISEDKAR